jgi:hypothetical protein
MTCTRRRGWVAAAMVATVVTLAAAVGLRDYLPYVKRVPTTYEPYLATSIDGAYERLAEFKAQPFTCHRDVDLGPFGRRWALPVPSNLGIERSFGSCYSWPDKDLTISLTGDSPEYVYAVQGSSRGPLGPKRKRVLVEAASVAAGGLESEVVERLVVSNGGTALIGQSFETDTARATISRSEEGGWTVTIGSADAETVARFLSSLQSIAPDPLAQEQSIAPERLARNFAPVFHFTKDEAFRPISIDALRGVARLCKKARSARQVDNESCGPLRDFPTNTPCGTGQCDEEWVVDLPPDEYDPAAYVDVEQDLRRGEYRKPVVYWHVADLGFRRVLTYWMYYIYNRFANLHEGDWETVQVDLIGSNSPDSVGVARWFFSSHEGGDTQPCTTLPSGCRHPDVFVAKGSHANYYTAGSHKAVATCPVGHHCITSLRNDKTEKSTDPLELGDYVLVELKDPPFIGRYGSANLKAKWVKVPDRLWTWDAPNDPRVRATWQKTPLASFEEAVGDEPPVRSWLQVALD